MAQTVIIIRVMVSISDDEANGSPRGFSLEDARQYLHLVRFSTRCGDAALSGPASAHFQPQQFLIEGDARRHTVDDSAYRCPMTFAEGGQSKYVSVSVHGKKKSNSGESSDGRIRHFCGSIRRHRRGVRSILRPRHGDVRIPHCHRRGVRSLRRFRILSIRLRSLRLPSAC